MSTKLTVDRVGPYGVQSNGTWYGVNRPLEPKSFEAGKTYSVEFKEGKNGKQYIAEIIAHSPNAIMPVQPSASVQPSYDDVKSS